MVNKGKLIFFLLMCLFMSLMVTSSLGAVDISLTEIADSLVIYVTGQKGASLHHRIFIEIRLPRAIMAAMVGAALSLGGALTQAYFRNPIVEPGLLGTSSGAAFGAALYFVFGSALPQFAGSFILPIMACMGAGLSSVMVVGLTKATTLESSSVVNMLLIAIAVNSIFLSGVGFLSYIAKDPQARSITFWSMGNLSGTNWQNLMLVTTVVMVSLVASMRLAKSLNAMVMGARDAAMMGINVKKLEWWVLLINVIMISVVTSFVGIIAFVGLITPHFARLLRGSNQRDILLLSAMLGALFLMWADFLSRMIVRPAELPIGILTSFVGGPVLIYLLRKKAYIF